MRKLLRPFTTLFLLLLPLKLYAYSYELVTQGLGTPWGLAFIDENTLLVTERGGTLYQLNIETNELTTLASLAQVVDSGQGGLLDIATSPVDSTTVYITYSKKTTDGLATTLATGSVKNGHLSKFEDIIVTDSATSTSRHFGSRITFDNENHLYFSIGDRGNRDNGQDTSNHAASILRLHLDGSIPKDNPYVNEPGIRDEIWSYGHRNPQGLFYDVKQGQLWSIEHGPRGGDEINLIVKGANYGWPVTSHGKEYWGPVAVADYKIKEGIESPKLVYIPSIAPGSLILYRGESYPELNGKLLAGALKLTHINVVNVDKNGVLEEENRIATNLNQRIRDIAVSPRGAIYFSTDNGNIYRLKK
jgi:glucose/arabinose dehydrogenase